MSDIAAAEQRGREDNADHVPTTLFGALDAMFETIPLDWWRYVPCDTCNANRQQPCQATDGPARGPHAARRRAAWVLYGTLWLIANEHATDVLGETP